MLSFEQLASGNSGQPARLGSLRFRSRNSIDTPHYVAASSRGAVPHIAQDMMRSNTRISAMYTALEDCKSLRDVDYRFRIMKTIFS